MPIETTQIELGERTFEIRTAPFARSRLWRRQLIGEVKPLFEQVAAAQDMTFETAADLLNLWPLAETLLVEGLDLIFEMVISYAEPLEAEREWIEQNATDQQIMAAFQEILRLGDFLGLMPMMSRRFGQMTIGTSTNSPAPNGATVSEPQKSS